MANVKITDYTEDTTPASNDWIETVDVSAGSNKKVTIANLFNNPPLANLSHSTTAVSNPYKFSVYRNGAFTNDAGTFKKVTFETESFDTNNNFDSTTNYRYTAPIDGFYFFSASYGFNTNPGTFGILSLYKNGTEVVRGVQLNASAAASVVVCGLLQLSATDYVEVYVYGTNAVSMDTNAAIRAKFQGFLVSNT